MDHIAIDLGGRESQLCIRSADGTIVRELRYRTAALGGLLGTMPASRVVLETCAESFAVADQARAHGHEVRIVPATLVKSLGVGARGKKTDVQDARTLSEVSCRIDLPSVHLPSEPARRLKVACGMRESLVRSRTLLVNSVRGFLRTQLQRIKGRYNDQFTARVRRQYSERLRPIPTEIERQLVVIDCLSNQIRQADRELALEAKNHPLCHRLMTVPGVGPITALRFVATIDEVERFGDASRIASYLGLVPGEWSSSDRQQRMGITKAGSPKLRWLLVQAAWSALRSKRGQELQQWTRQVEHRRGSRVAVVALARKLSGIMFAIWRDGTEYQPSRAARPVPAAS